MMKVTIVGLDLAKSVFQVHGADKEGRPVVRKKLRRGQVLAFFAGLSPCLIGLEACASAHYWARELRALGHAVRLIPPQYVHLSLLLTPSGAETLVFWVSRPLPWPVAPKGVPLMTRRGDFKLSHGATAKARENAVKQDRVPTTNAIKSP